MDASFSFSDTSCSDWASLVTDQVQLQVNANIIIGGDNKVSAKINNDSFSQILTILVNQAALLDQTRGELARLQEENTREREENHRRVRHFQEQAKRQLEEYNGVAASLKRLRTELANAKAQTQPLHTHDKRPGTNGQSILPMEEHLRIVRGLEQDAKTRVGFVEAEKAELVFQNSRLQIELTQLRNDGPGGSSVFDTGRHTIRADDGLARNVMEMIEQKFGDVVTERNRSNEALKAAESRNSELMEDLDQYQKSLAEAENRCEDLTVRCEDYEREINERDVHISDLNAQLAYVPDRSEAGVETEEVWEDVHATCREEMDLLKQENVNLQVAFDGMTLELENERSDFTNLQSEWHQTLQVVTDRELALSQVSNELLNLTAENSKLRESEAALQSRLTESELQSTTIQNELESLKQSLNQKDEQLTNRQTELADLVTERDRLQKVLNEVQEQCATSEAELRIARDGALELLDSKGQALLEVIKASETGEGQLINQLWKAAIDRVHDQTSQKIENIRAESEQRIKELTKSLEGSEKRRSEVAILDENLQQELCSVLAENNQLQENLAELKESLENAEKQVKELESVIDRHEDEERESKDQFSTQISALEAQRKQLSSDLEKLKNGAKDKFDEATKKLRAAKATLQEKEKALAKAIAEEKTHRELADGFKSKNATLSEQLAEASEALEELRMLHSRAVSDSEKIRLDLATLESARVEEMIAFDEAKADLEGERSRVTEVTAEKEKFKEECIAAQKQLGEVMKLNASLKSKLGRAEARIERLDAARARMAAIYGLSTATTPLPSPDRPHPTPSQYAPMSSPLSTEVPGRKLKRARYSKPNLVEEADEVGRRSGSPLSQAMDSDSLSASSPPNNILPLLDTPTAANFHNQVWGSIATSPTTGLPHAAEPTKEQTLTYLEKFAKMSSWRATNGEWKCGFCCLESRRHQLNFDPHENRDKFWVHCRRAHPKYWSPGLRSTLPEREEISLDAVIEDAAKMGTRHVISAPIWGTTDLEPPEERLRAVITRFAIMSTWQAARGKYKCGLCEIVSPGNTWTLQFDALVQPHEFWAHCLGSHNDFWDPKILASGSPLPRDLAWLY